MAARMEKFRSGSVRDEATTELPTFTQVNRIDNVNSNSPHEKSQDTTNVRTWSTGPGRDDGDSTPTNHLISVTSLAQGTTTLSTTTTTTSTSTSTFPAISSSFSKEDLLPTTTTVLTSENQSDDATSTYRPGFTDRRQVKGDLPSHLNATPSIDSDRSTVVVDAGSRLFGEEDVNVVTSTDRRNYGCTILLYSSTSSGIVIDSNSLSDLPSPIKTSTYYFGDLTQVEEEEGVSRIISSYTKCNNSEHSSVSFLDSISRFSDKLVTGSVSDIPFTTSQQNISSKTVVKDIQSSFVPGVSINDIPHNISFTSTPNVKFTPVPSDQFALAPNNNLTYYLPDTTAKAVLDIPLTSVIEIESTSLPDIPASADTRGVISPETSISPTPADIDSNQIYLTINQKPGKHSSSSTSSENFLDSKSHSDLLIPNWNSNSIITTSTPHTPSQQRYTRLFASKLSASFDVVSKVPSSLLNPKESSSSLVAKVSPASTYQLPIDVPEHDTDSYRLSTQLTDLSVGPSDTFSRAFEFEKSDLESNQNILDQTNYVTQVTGSTTSSAWSQFDSNKSGDLSETWIYSIDPSDSDTVAVVSTRSAISDKWNHTSELSDSISDIISYTKSFSISHTMSSLEFSKTTMSQELMPSQTLSVDAMALTSSPSATDYLSQPVVMLKTTDLVQLTPTLLPPSINTNSEIMITKGDEGTLMPPDNLPSPTFDLVSTLEDSSKTTYPNQVTPLPPPPPPPSSLVTPQLTPVKTQWTETEMTDVVAMDDPGYKNPMPSSSKDQAVFETQISQDEPENVDISSPSPHKSSSSVLYSSKVLSSQKSRRISVTPTVSLTSTSLGPITPTTSWSVEPSASIFIGGQENMTSVAPGKTNTNHDDGPLSGNAPIIIGAACGVFFVGVVIVITLLCVLRRKRPKKAPKRDPRVEDLWVDIGRDRLAPPSVNVCLDPYDSQIQITSDQLYRATKSYTSKQDGYLSFVIGDLLRVSEVSDNGWWRGVALKDGATGWFPCVSVREVKGDEKVMSETCLDKTDGVKLDVQGQVSSFQIRKCDPDDTRPLVKENVDNHGTLSPKTYTDDVASWVKMSASVSMSSLRSIDTIGTTSTLNDNNFSVKGVHYRAIYSYKPVCKGEMGLKEGELVVCKERDKNGWMLGVKPKTKEEGWFPAVYVDGVSSEDATLKEEDVPATYDLLDSNKLHNVTQPWIGIEHKAVRPFTSDVQGDLNIQANDVIVVFQTLANGWWFGSKDKKSGWFPGAYVEMTEGRGEIENGTLHSSNPTSPSTTHSSDAKDALIINQLSPFRKSPLAILKYENGKNESSRFFTFSGTNSSSPYDSATASPRDSYASSVASDNDLKPLVSPKQGGASATSTLEGRFKKVVRPNRKAPAPPSSTLQVNNPKDFTHPDGTHSLRRPVRKAPAPPTRQHSKAESDMSSLNSPVGSIRLKDILNPPPFKKPTYVLNGKIPRLVKVHPELFDEKCLNPVIRPATRGLAPILSTQMSKDKDSVSPTHSHGSDAYRTTRNGHHHEVERRGKSRSITPLHLRIHHDHRLSTSSKASYGSAAETITSDHALNIDQRKSPSSWSRSSTPTILHAPSMKSGKTATIVPPPMVPKFHHDDDDDDDDDDNVDDDLPPPPPPPPPFNDEHLDQHPILTENTSRSTDSSESPQSAADMHRRNEGEYIISVEFNDDDSVLNANDIDGHSNSSPTNNSNNNNDHYISDSNGFENMVNQVNSNNNEIPNQTTGKLSSHQHKTPPNTLPKPRFHDKSPLSSFGKGSIQLPGIDHDHDHGESEDGDTTTDVTDVQRRPSEVSRSGSPPCRESLDVVPGKVSEIIHHLNSMSPQSAFPPVLEGTEVPLIIPQCKQSMEPNRVPVNNHTPPGVFQNGQNNTEYNNDHASTNNNRDTSKEMAHDLSQINQNILEKNTFVPIKDDDLPEIEDRVSTFRSLPRPSRKTSKDMAPLTLALDDSDNIKSYDMNGQYVPFFKQSTFDEKVTEL